MNASHSCRLSGLRSFTLMVLIAIFLLSSAAPSQAQLSVIHETQRLAPGGAPYLAFFGQDMVVKGNTMLVSSENTSVEGKVYIFQRDWLGSWYQSAAMQVSDPSNNIRFNYSLALTSDTAFVGDPYEPVGNGSSTGVIHMFKRQSGNVWTAAGTILPGDPVPFGRFGTSLAVDGNTLVVGAAHSYDLGSKTPGVVYVFSKDSTGKWQQVDKLFSQERYDAREFGSEVAISGDRILIADSSLFNDDISFVGAVYAFERDGSTGRWNQTDILLPSGPAQNYCFFGFALAMHGSRAVIGSLQSAAFVFERDETGNWTEVKKLQPIETSPQFGESIAIDGDNILVGDIFGTSKYQAYSTGKAYLFHRDNEGSWSEAAVFEASDAQDDDTLGRSVALSGNQVFVGQYSNMKEYGSIYVFPLPTSTTNNNVVFLPMLKK